MMVSRGLAMAGPDPSRGEGERREAAIRRRRYIVIGALFAAGLVTGLYAGFREGSALFDGGDSAWPPAVALAMIGLFVVAMIGGTIVMQGVMDEHERERTYKAASFSAALLLIGYPIWFLLWKGGFTAAPVHWIMYVVFVAGTLLASLYYRFR